VKTSEKTQRIAEGKEKVRRAYHFLFKHLCYSLISSAILCVAGGFQIKPRHFLRRLPHFDAMNRVGIVVKTETGC
jgi:hypothetical protein